ncbi:YtxH domain-containing protein [Cytophaga aurantiaca]|uniref:YtxH domain-containing protein n=1 Tax=Cytophaga aurantiaca TaxID=29530 RepID=UPI0003706366|nr:YtxH domain-containing protein [Cytophaga aurantiaca]
MSSGKVLLGVLAGVAVGALVGTLLAPDKGSETRKKILDKGEGYVDDLKDQFDELLAALKDKYADKAEDLLAKGKSKYNEAKNEFKSSVAEV